MIMPVQSGSDAILAAMKRNHGHLEYRRVLGELRRVSPRTIVRTHLLVGFPGETEEDFRATLDLARAAPLDSYFVHGYSEREFTAAAGLPGGVAEAVIARRVRRLRNADLLNWLRPSRWLPLRP
jgi:tRNA-2-methylthio-N6-dimethylallyladenosine synthase